jgi:hypothetical protein
VGSPLLDKTRAILITWVTLYMLLPRKCLVGSRALSGGRATRRCTHLELIQIEVGRQAKQGLIPSALRQRHNRSCQTSFQLSLELLPMPGKAPSLCRVRYSAGSPIVENAVSRHSPDLSTPTKMT